MINSSRFSRGPSRRDLMKLGLLPVSLISGRASALAQGSLAQSRTLTADEALRRLTAGNQRFVKGEPVSPRRSPADFAGQAEAQFPKAMVISCSDSRVAPEILFDVGVGDIFVVRVAGDVVIGAGDSVKG